MKKVFSSHKEVSHIWASQSQSEGRANNIFFDGASIFSYGRHFEIARIFTNCVLFTSKGYSSSTGKHKSIVYRAISHKKVFEVPFVNGNHAENVLYFVDGIKDNVLKSKKARSYAESYYNSAIDLQGQLTEYCKEFALNLPDIGKENLFTEKDIAIIKEKTEKAQAQAKIRQEKRRKEWEAQRIRYELQEKEREEKDKENLAKWLTGENVNLSYRVATLLRIKNDVIETTKGANVPLKEGIALFQSIKQGQNVIGQKVGVYTVDGIEGDTVSIGCHNISLKEAERVFASLTA